VSLRKAAAEKNITLKISMGGAGQFQVLKDGAVIFDYRQAGTLPSTTELLQLIQN
jgi:predicted Rdx family selenoprotein